MSQGLRIGGWLLGGAALAASLSPLFVQLAFAVASTGIIGMAHGASDLAVVKRDRQQLFLAGYGLVIVLCLLWWHWDPAVALPGFLLASACHFALEDAPQGTITERLARGVSMIAAPAALHLSAYDTILRQAGLSSSIPDAAISGMAFVGGICATALAIAGVLRRDRRLVAGMVALLVLPPLVGFSLGFLILHALPQTRLRREQLSCASYGGYLRAVWPVLSGAIVLGTATLFVMQPADSAGMRSLFAALAALAIPHMLITPWFEARRQT